VLPGGAELGEALVAEPAVRVIAFTGSTRAGRQVAAAAAGHLERVHLEPGGNSALIVLDDVDVEEASSVGAWGSFVHQGQVCMAAGRHIVQESIAEDYVTALAARADKLPVGDPASGQVALGPVIDVGQRDRIHGMVTQAVEAGARPVAGGTYESLFYRPTVLADVPVTAPAYSEEVFGPVAPVVRFGSIDELVALASATPYGLSLGILTRDVMRGLEIAERIPSGLVHINDQPINDEATIPFGGVKSSGTGARHGGGAGQHRHPVGDGPGLPAAVPDVTRPPRSFGLRHTGCTACLVRESPNDREPERTPDMVGANGGVERDSMTLTVLLSLLPGPCSRGRILPHPQGGDHVQGLATTHRRHHGSAHRAGQCLRTHTGRVHPRSLTVAEQLDRWATLFEENGYAPFTPGWPEDPETVEEAKAHPEVRQQDGRTGGRPLRGRHPGA
jgi:Aldehyde dehydrogenase family